MESSQKGKVIFDLKKVVEEIDWNNPMNIHDEILHSVLEDAVGTFSLNELEKEICRELNNEVSQLEEIKNLCQQLVKEEKSKEVSEELLTAAKEITEVEEDIKALK